MNITGYQGPYEHGMPTRFIAEDGTIWREATPKELADAPPDLLVCIGLTGEPHPAGYYADLRFPGNYAFLPGVAALRPVFVLDNPGILRMRGDRPSGILDVRGDYRITT